MSRKVSFSVGTGDPATWSRSRSQSIAPLLPDDPADVNSPDRVFTQIYPLLYSQNKNIEDAFVHEMYSVLKNSTMIPLLSFVEWDSIPTSPVVLNISDQPIQLVGGMLFAAEGFCFEEMPFVLNQVKDVKCRVELEWGDDLTKDASTQGTGVFQTAVEVDSSSSPYPVHGGGSYSTVPNQELKITFRMWEYQSVTDVWVVQSFQQVTADGLKGKFFTKAFLPVYQPVTAPTTKTSQLRNLVYGEEKLRTRNPKLLKWCLQHDPFELGSAATIIKHTFQYFKYSFSVLRTVKLLMKAIRVVQRFCKVVVWKRRGALNRALKEWEKIETETIEKVRRTAVLPGDEVEAIVKETLLQTFRSKNSVKLLYVEAQWKAFRDRYREQLKEDFMKPEPFKWNVNVRSVVSRYEKDLVDSLTMGEDGRNIFRHPRIVALISEEPRPTASS
jgi:hypothetical protein